AQNRRNRGLWQAASPSRFVDELPETNVEVIERKSPYGGSGGGTAGVNPYGHRRLDEPAAGLQSGHNTPGWQRAKERTSREDRTGRGPRAPVTLEGELVASSAS